MISAKHLGTAKLAVLGSPIAHSLSPTLHEAAYRVLGLDWSYTATEVTADQLSEFIDSCGDDWRGLSLTMPLKKQVMCLIDSADRVATLTGVANTLLFENGSIRGFNTDVVGITRALEQHGLAKIASAAILGGGATARSAFVAAAALGAQEITMFLRSSRKAGEIEPLAARLGIDLKVRPLAETNSANTAAELHGLGIVISTLPNSAGVELQFPEQVRRSATLFDVAYEPWPTPLAVAWQEASGEVVPGIQMLVQQALVQIRIFVSGNPDHPLPREDEVLAAMQTSVGSV